MITKGSAAKRHRQSEKRRMKNKAIRSEVRSGAKRVLTAVASNERSAADEAYRAYVALVDSATRKGVYHKNAAGRKKSRMAHRVNAIQS